MTYELGSERALRLTETVREYLYDIRAPSKYIEISDVRNVTILQGYTHGPHVPNAYRVSMHQVGYPRGVQFYCSFDGTCLLIGPGQSWIYNHVQEQRFKMKIRETLQGLKLVA